MTVWRVLACSVRTLRIRISGNEEFRVNKLTRFHFCYCYCYCCYYLRRHLAGEGIVPLGVTLSRCVYVCRIFMSMEFIVMDTKSFTKHWNFEIVRETGLHPNLLTDWHDALVGISPRTTQPITTNRHLCRRSERPFFLSRVYSEFIPPIMQGVTFGELFRG